MTIHSRKTNLDEGCMDFFRSTLYIGQRNIMPVKMTWTGPQSAIDMDVLARRIGLIPFQIEDKNRACSFTLVNDTDAWRMMRASDLVSANIRALMPDQILADMPPHTGISATLYFEEGCGVDHARFDLLVKRFHEDGTVEIQHPYSDAKEALRRSWSVCKEEIQRMCVR